MEIKRFTYLFHKYISLTATEGESSEFVALAAKSDYHDLLQELSQQFDVAENQAPGMDAEASHLIFQSIFDLDNNAPNVVRTPIPTVHRVHFLKTGWFRYAAILLLIAGTAVFLTQYYLAPKEIATQVTDVQSPDILPGKNKAILTLADGTVIPLDSSSSGNIAQQGNSSIVKMPDGEIRYELNGVPQGAVLMNTMSVPKGGQYRLTLPDGTKVWLNAASSITYPAAFITDTRKISIAGEAYFEVAQDRSRPFIVEIEGAGSVQVLGTNFNINAYKDYSAVKTTLVSGKVRVIGKNRTTGATGRQSVSDAVVLSPGQQAVQETGSAITAGGAARSLRIVEAVDLPQVLAWKNGIFDFNGADFNTVMKEVERWYDVDVKYEGAIPAIKFGGKMDRAVKLSGVIRFLNEYGIQARLNGQTLIIKGV